MRISDWSSDVCSSDLRLRDGPPVVRHVVELHQPDARADRTVHQGGRVSERRLCPAQASRRKGRGAAPRKAGREAVQAVAEAGGLYRRAGRRAVQARSLPLLIAASRTAKEKGAPVDSGALSYSASAPSLSRSGPSHSA